MRICDRCGGKPIKKILQDKQEFTEFDLCIQCHDDFILFLDEKKEPTCPAGKKVKKVEKVKKVTKPNK